MTQQYLSHGILEDMMHHIQRAILRNLMRGDSLRYRDIKPAGVESNLFAYHLKALMQEGYVEQAADKQYSLTADGKRYVDTLSPESLKPRLQPKIVILLAVRDRLGRWLLMRRKVQPLLGQVGLPYGKLHLGETIHEATHRELFEKTGLKSELKHVGDGYVTIEENGAPVSEIFFHLFRGTAQTDKLHGNHMAGEIFWSDLAPDWGNDQYLKSMPDIMRLLEDLPENRFFVELDYN